jgi:hypothetical protein
MLSEKRMKQQGKETSNQISFFSLTNELPDTIASKDSPNVDFNHLSILIDYLQKRMKWQERTRSASFP